MTTTNPTEAKKHLAEALAILCAAQVGADALKDELKHPVILVTAAEEGLDQINGYLLDETLIAAGAALKRAFDALGGTQDELAEASRAYVQRIIAEGRRLIAEGEVQLAEIEAEEMRRRGHLPS